MSEWKIKRTWDTVEVKQTEAGFLVALDDRPIVTPAKNPLLLVYFFIICIEGPEKGPLKNETDGQTRFSFLIVDFRLPC